MFIKRRLVFFILVTSFYIAQPNVTLAQTLTIQEQINQADPGDTIELSSDTFEENIIIDRPIHLIGQGHTKLVQRKDNPAITINSQDVTIENITVVHEDPTGEKPAIYVTGDRHELKHIQIQTNSYGVYLDEVNDSKLSHLTIIGKKGQALNERKHGVYLWKSNHNLIEHTNLHYVQDGIYIEKSHETTLYKNSTQDSRYGYHLMFTTNSVLEYNEAFDNVSGLYVMGDQDTLIQHNELINNRENVQSIGLFIFDTTNALVKENIIEHNRIGIYIESAEANELYRNKVQHNYIGLQFKDAQKNKLKTNSFDANIVQGQAINSSNNSTDGNYWGDHRGLDLTGNQISDMTYQVDPFFLNVTNQYPAFQLLFQSPGLQFLQQLMHTPDEQLLIDHKPFIEDPLLFSTDQTEGSWGIIGISLLMLCFSIYIIYLGVNIYEKN